MYLCFYVGLLLFSFTELICSFILGDGIGGTEKKISNSLKGEACVAACLERKKWDLDINGVTVLQNGEGGCWCEIKMTSTSYSKKYKTCLLLPEGVDRKTDIYFYTDSFLVF